jgi:two-component sensor histidine kinase
MGDGVILYRGFAARMRVLASLTGLIIALVPPITFFSMNWKDQKVAADRLSQEVSQKLRATVKANPELWKFSVVKFVQVFDEVESQEIAEIRIFESGGVLLAKTAFGGRTVLRRTGNSDIVYNNILFGRVELDKRADSALYQTAVLFAAFAVLAALVGFALFHYPATIIRRAEESINATIASLNREVLERTRKEEEIGESLREKEILLKEVHHRVKNNLQIIISLISLQLHGAERNGASEMLMSIKHRVNTMAIVHERLYESPSLYLIEMGEYLRSLLFGYFESFEDERVALRYAVNVADISLSIDYAMPIGLIVCELVINSLKYAFTGRESGLVEVTLQKIDENRLRLTVSDDGKGLGEGRLGVERTGLGFQLVSSLTSQIRGELSMESGAGLRVTVDNITLAAPPSSQ